MRKFLLCFTVVMIALTSLVIAEGVRSPLYTERSTKSIKQPVSVVTETIMIKAVTEPTVVVKEAMTTRYPGEFVSDTDVTLGNNTVYVPYDAMEDFEIKVLPIYNQKPVALYTKPDLIHNATSVSIGDLKAKNFNVINGRFLEVTDIGSNEYFVDIRNAHIIPQLKAGVNKTIRVQNDGTAIYSDQLNLTTDVMTKTNMTAYDVSKLTAGTGLEGIEQAVVDIERRYGINALFTLALATVESGAGESWLAVNRNNLFGIAAYDSDTDAAYYFESKAACVYEWGELIYEDYFCEGLQTLVDINGKYASNPYWHSDVGSVMQSMANDLTHL